MWVGGTDGPRGGSRSLCQQPRWRRGATGACHASPASCPRPRRPLARLPSGVTPSATPRPDVAPPPPAGRWPSSQWRRALGARTASGRQRELPRAPRSRGAAAGSGAKLEASAGPRRRLRAPPPRPAAAPQVGRWAPPGRVPPSPAPSPRRRRLCRGLARSRRRGPGRDRAEPERGAPSHPECDPVRARVCWRAVSFLVIALKHFCFLVFSVSAGESGRPGLSLGAWRREAPADARAVPLRANPSWFCPGGGWPLVSGPCAAGVTAQIWVSPPHP